MELKDNRPSPPISITPYQLSDWHILWELRDFQLAESGIIVPPEDKFPAQPLDVGRDDYEWDYHHIAEIYLSDAGGFWLAWWENEPAGHIGAQDLGGVVELRRMYIRAEYRRRGIASRLVRALLDHCKTRSIAAVELWTREDGVGRKLYERIGFKTTDRPGKEFVNLNYRTNFTPGNDEIRMRFDLA